MPTREQELAIRLKQSDKVIIGLLDIARLAMPYTFYQTDSRVEAARKHLGKKFPVETQ